MAFSLSWTLHNILVHVQERSPEDRALVQILQPCSSYFLTQLESDDACRAGGAGVDDPDFLPQLMDSRNKEIERQGTKIELIGFTKFFICHPQFFRKL